MVQRLNIGIRLIHGDGTRRRRGTNVLTLSFYRRHRAVFGRLSATLLLGDSCLVVRSENAPINSLPGFAMSGTVQWPQGLPLYAFQQESSTLMQHASPHDLTPQMVTPISAPVPVDMPIAFAQYAVSYSAVAGMADARFGAALPGVPVAQATPIPVVLSPSPFAQRTPHATAAADLHRFARENRMDIDEGLATATATGAAPAAQQAPAAGMAGRDATAPPEDGAEPRERPDRYENQEYHYHTPAMDTPQTDTPPSDAPPTAWPGYLPARGYRHDGTTFMPPCTAKERKRYSFLTSR